MATLAEISEDHYGDVAGGFEHIAGPANRVADAHLAAMLAG